MKKLSHLFRQFFGEMGIDNFFYLHGLHNLCYGKLFAKDFFNEQMFDCDSGNLMEI